MYKAVNTTGQRTHTNDTTQDKEDIKMTPSLWKEMQEIVEDEASIIATSQRDLLSKEVRHLENIQSISTIPSSYVVRV